MESRKPASFEHSFLRLQKTIANEVFNYKSLLTQSKISHLKPEIYGKYYLKVNGDKKFRIASIEIHRMMLTAKISKFKTTPVIRNPATMIGKEGSSYLKKGTRNDGKSNNLERLQIFLPEWNAEYVEYYDSHTSSSPSSCDEGEMKNSFDQSESEEEKKEVEEIKKMIVLYNMDGTRVKISASSTRDIKKMWLYFYSRCIQRALPNFIKRTEEVTIKNGISRKKYKYGFKKPSNFLGYKVHVVDLSDTPAIKRSTSRWLFCLNIDKLKNFLFTKPSMMTINQDSLVYCEYNAAISMPIRSNIYSRESPQNVKLFIYKLKELIHLIMNLGHRSVFVSRDFDLQQVMYNDGVFFFESLKGLVLKPEIQQYPKDLLKNLIYKLFRIAKDVTVEDQSAEIKHNLLLVKEIFQKVRFENLKTLREVNTFLRINYADLTLSQEKSLIGFNQTDKLGANTLDRKLQEANNAKTGTKDFFLSGLSMNDAPSMPTERKHLKSKFGTKEHQDFDQKFFGANDVDASQNPPIRTGTLNDVGEEGNIESTSRRRQRTRSIFFKNKFLGQQTLLSFSSRKLPRSYLRNGLIIKLLAM